MKNITSKELRKLWLDFYKSKGHVDIGAVSLIGDGSTGVMFNVAGMQPLMPYLLGKKHPSGSTRLCNVQGCVRTVDIDEVGDACHCTFFEMLGNWSLGDYFKKEKTAWTLEFLTKVLGFDKNKICSTVFAGNKNAPRDNETAKLLMELGIPKERIYFLEDNWWELEGTVNTPCGPDNEWFYPIHDKPCSEHCDVTCECGRWVEIGNDVFMQYKKLANGVEELSNKNVDTGFGFERLLMYVNGLTDCFKTDLFTGVIEKLEQLSGFKYGENEEITRTMRIIADHTRTTVMLIGDKDGIVPSNVGSGYILRRIMRRAIRYFKQLGVDPKEMCSLANIFIDEVYNEAYPILKEKKDHIMEEILKEIKKFEVMLVQGLKEFDKVINGLKRKNEFMAKENANYVEDRVITGKSAFRLFDTFGFPLELTKELASELSYSVDEEGFKQAFKAHQEASKSLNKGEAKGGLEEQNEMTTRLHTATHLLQAGLIKFVNSNIRQKGSNITSERLRFDFNCDHKLTTEELKQVEDYVNECITKAIPITREEMSPAKALENGALGEFSNKYGDTVSVYTIGDVSKEICMGPHAKNTSELHHFKIVKEESSSSGIRRIKAILN